MKVFAKSAIRCTGVWNLVFVSFQMSERALQYVRACEQGVQGKKDNLDQWLHFIQDYWQMDTFPAAFTYVNVLKGCKAAPGAPPSLLAPAQRGLRWRTLLETSLLLSGRSTASVSSSASFPGSSTQRLQLSVWWGWCNVSQGRPGSPQPRGWRGEVMGASLVTWCDDHVRGWAAERQVCWDSHCIRKPNVKLGDLLSKPY